MAQDAPGIIKLLQLLCCCGDADKPARVVRSKIVDWRCHPVVQQYKLLELIGEGGFSEVWKAEHKVSHDLVGIKVVFLNKPGLDPVQAKILEGEAKFLKMLDHPNILHCREVLETKYDLVLVLDYLSGGEMLDHLHQLDHYSEAQACHLFQQVVEGVAYMHDLNIMHRDIKPENVMFSKPVAYYQKRGKPIKVKLIDLGMAEVYNPEYVICGCMGSPGFMAPEIIKAGEHTPAMDIYGLGVLLFVMLCGRKPFDLKDVHTLMYAQKTIDQAPGLSDPRFRTISRHAQQLLLWMLNDEPSQRPTAHQVLAHPWIREQGGSRHLAINSLVRQRIARLASLRRFKGLAFALMADHQEGPGVTDPETFLKSIQQQRKAVHLDLRDRAKQRVRERASLDKQRASLEMTSQKANQQQQAQQQQDKGMGRKPGPQTSHHTPTVTAKGRANGYAPEPAGPGWAIAKNSFAFPRLSPLSLVPENHFQQPSQQPQPRISRESISSQQPLLRGPADSDLYQYNALANQLGSPGQSGRPSNAGYTSSSGGGWGGSGSKEQWLPGASAGSESRGKHAARHKHTASTVEPPAKSATGRVSPFQRSWSAPEAGTVPNILENAIGMPTTQAAELPKPSTNTSTSQLMAMYAQTRAMSMDPLALAFLADDGDLASLLGLKLDTAASGQRSSLDNSALDYGSPIMGRLLSLEGSYHGGWARNSSSTVAAATSAAAGPAVASTSNGNLATARLFGSPWALLSLVQAGAGGRRLSIGTSSSISDEAAALLATNAAGLSARLSSSGGAYPDCMPGTPLLEEPITTRSVLADQSSGALQVSLQQASSQPQDGAQIMASPTRWPTVRHIAREPTLERISEASTRMETPLAGTLAGPGGLSADCQAGISTANEAAATWQPLPVSAAQPSIVRHTGQVCISPFSGAFEPFSTSHRVSGDGAGWREGAMSPDAEFEMPIFKLSKS